MTLRPLATAALGIGLAMAVPAVAEAYTSYTTATVNLRSGPSTGYASYGALPAGTAVDVRYCQVAWCEASSFLGTGWVSAGYLSGARVEYPRAYPTPYPYRTYQPYPYRTYQPYPYYAPYPYRRYPRSGFGFYFRVP